MIRLEARGPSSRNQFSRNSPISLSFADLETASLWTARTGEPLFRAAGAMGQSLGFAPDIAQPRVGTARPVRIFKTYGADAVQVMTENPIGSRTRRVRSHRELAARRITLERLSVGVHASALRPFRPIVQDRSPWPMPTAPRRSWARPQDSRPEDFISRDIDPASDHASPSAVSAT